MNFQVTKIDRELNNESIDQLIETCITNKPFTRDTIQTLTADNFFNSKDLNSIRSEAGFIAYYQSLNEDEVSCLKALFKLMGTGINVFIMFDDSDNIDSVDEAKQHIQVITKSTLSLDSLYYRPIIFTAGYQMDENNFCCNYIAGKLPGTRDLINLINSYNLKHIDCKLSLEDLLVEAMKQEGFDSE